MKKVLTAAVVVASMALVACGSSSDKSSSDTTAASGGSNKALSYSDLGKQLDAYCTKVNADIKPLGDKITGDPANDAPILKQLVPKLQSATDGLSAFKPPAELEAAFTTFKADTQAQVDASKAALTAADSGDTATYQAAIQALQPIGQKTNEDASKVGSAACAK
jgi:hypothetical protein